MQFSHIFRIVSIPHDGLKRKIAITLGMENDHAMNRYCKLFIWIAVLWLSTNGCALAAKSEESQGKEASPQASSAQEAPAMSVSESTHDFGEVTEGAEVTHDFLVKNTGSGSLQIEQVRPG